MRAQIRKTYQWIVALVLCLTAAVAPARADTTIIIDTDTLNTIISPMSLKAADIPLSKSSSVRVTLDELRVLGIDPSGGVDKRGVLLTSLRLEVEALGIAITVKPALSLHVVAAGARSVLELRFEEVVLPLPLGSIDIARMLAPIRFPAETIFHIGNDSEAVPFRSKIADVKMNSKAVYFTMAIDVIEPRQ
jgi:hypothetical protein